MLERLRKKVKEEGEGGFTLIELLVVLIIIGILAAIAIPVFLNQRKKGVDASIKSDLKQAANEVESAYTDTQEYPAAATDITIKGSKDNVIQYVKVDATSYCLLGFNSKATADSAAKAYYYTSKNGGLKTTTTGVDATTCGAATTFANVNGSAAVPAAPTT